MSKSNVEDDSLMGDVAAAQLRISGLGASKEIKRQKALEEAAKIKEKWKKESAVELQRSIMLIAKSAGIYEVNAGAFERELQEKMKKTEPQAKPPQGPQINERLDKIVDKFVNSQDTLSSAVTTASRDVAHLLGLKNLTRGGIANITQAFMVEKGLEPDIRKAAIKIALYHRLFPKEEAVEQTAGIIAEHVFKAPQDKKLLEKEVKNITSSIINKSNPLEVKALDDTSRKIAEAALEKPASAPAQSAPPMPLAPTPQASAQPAPQKGPSLSFKEKIKKAWRSLVDSLPSFRKVNKIGIDLQGLVVATPVHSQSKQAHDTPQQAPGAGRSQGR